MPRSSSSSRSAAGGGPASTLIAASVSTAASALSPASACELPPASFSLCGFGFELPESSSSPQATSPNITEKHNNQAPIPRTIVFLRRCPLPERSGVDHGCARGNSCHSHGQHMKKTPPGVDDASWHAAGG